MKPISEGTKGVIETSDSGRRGKPCKLSVFIIEFDQIKTLRHKLFLFIQDFKILLWYYCLVFEEETEARMRPH